MTARALDQNRSEWLEADGLGGYASGTVCGIRTRGYHALLLVATNPPSQRMVLVNGFDAEVETDAGRWAISTQRYAPGVNTPDGSSRLAAFALDPWPQWTWNLAGNLAVIHELFVPRDHAAIVLRWRMRGDCSNVRLLVRPFFSGRDFGAMHHENPVFDFDPNTFLHGQRWQLYPGVPGLRALCNGDYHHQPCWYRNFLYDEEVERGLPSQEDLAAPGLYTFDLKDAPAALIFSADGLGTPLDESRAAPELAADLAETEVKRRSVFAHPRLRAVDAYLARRGTGRTIMAGYPWFGDWGRDTFIAIRGLCLATGRLSEARNILVTWAGLVSEGMLPNCIANAGDQVEYNSVDASLWYVIVVYEFLEAVQADNELSRCKETLLQAVDSILTGYQRGTRYGIHADTNGLLACGVPGVQLTWMDAKVDNRVVTPRVGKPVEVQALWLNALGLTARSLPQWQPAYEKGRQAFESRFWNEDRGCLYDVVDVDHQAGTVDATLRPNQIFAVGGLPISFFEGERAGRVVQLVQDRLWTPMGLRSLAPGEKGYVPHYQGDAQHRDGAYHQGTVWPWLAGPFLEAWVRVHGDDANARAQARDLLNGSNLLRLDLQGLEHVPEIADAEPPYTARGCPFQAWSLGEVLRLEYKILLP